MISLVTNLVNLLATSAQWLFIAASLLGQIIVKIITTIFVSILNGAKSVVLFFRIVYEDNFVVFSEEIPTLVLECLDTILGQWFQVHNYFSVIFYNVGNNFKLIVESVKWYCEEILLIISESILLWKRAVIFLGETLWLVLTFIPVHLPHLMTEIWKYLKDRFYYIAVEAYTSLLKFTNFLSDVPLESFIGLLVTMLIVRLCIHFRDNLRSQTSALYWIIIRKVLYVYHMIYNYFNDYETRLIAHMISGQQLPMRQDNVMTSAEDLSNAAEALCVICQERPKCVLTLPCRHVCLCSECCMRLYGYQRTCPICRTFIYHSVTVYL